MTWDERKRIWTEITLKRQEAERSAVEWMVYAVAAVLGGYLLAVILIAKYA